MLNLTDGHGFQPYIHVEERLPMCYLNINNQVFCYSMETAQFLFLVVGLLFAYQILFVWKNCFQYTIYNESRVRLMWAGILYCLGNFILYFFTGFTKVFLGIVLGFMEYQILAFTFLIYFHKITSILLQIQKKWTRYLYYAHGFATVVMLACAIAQLVVHMDEDDYNCAFLSFSINPYLGVMVTADLMYLAFGLILWQLKNRISGL